MSRVAQAYTSLGLVWLLYRRGGLGYASSVKRDPKMNLSIQEQNKRDLLTLAIEQKRPAKRGKETY